MSVLDAPEARSHRRHPSSALTAGATALLLCLGGLGLAPAAAAAASPSPTAAASASASAKPSTSAKPSASAGTSVAAGTSASPSPSASEQPPVPAPTYTLTYPRPVNQAYGSVPIDGCDTLARVSWGWLPNGNDATLSVEVPRSTDPLTVEFHFYDAAAPNTDLQSGPAESVDTSGTARFTVKTASLLDGHAYGWHAVARDAAGRTSAPTTACHFRIDRTPPTVALQNTNQVAHIGSWTQYYDWTDKPAADGTKPVYMCAEVRFENSAGWSLPYCNWSPGQLIAAPDTPGPTVAHIRTVDPAGNRSAEVTRAVFVYPNTSGVDLLDPFAQWALTRDAKGADSFGRSPLTPSGAVSWVDTTTVQGSPSSTAASLDGGSSLGSSQAVVDTTKSFSVNVYAKSSDANVGGVVLSQDATRSSGFILWADPADHHWRFSMGVADSDNAVWDNTDIDRFWSPVVPVGLVQPANVQRLTASYNASTGAMALWVDGELASTGYHNPAKAWKANGPLRVGQYQVRGYPSLRFKGQVSDLALVARPANFRTEDAARYQEPASLSVNFPGCMDTDPTEPTGRGQLIRFENCSTAKGLSAWRADGTVRQAGLCLDVANNGTANGSVIELWDCNGGANQQWIPRANGSLYNPVSGRCVDLPWGNRVVNNAMTLFDCHGGTNQSWSPLHPLMSGPQ
ncbi:ricin-type beta-trefoil lectin domain protein [Kitasatospora griseola]|uniref:ricin-type beta-trefoil lectin domain protein n=1 Tax=Kitasatospora griseola TaxID=2064 RepID=UPI0037F590C2